MEYQSKIIQLKDLETLGSFDGGHKGLELKLASICDNNEENSPTVNSEFPIILRR